MSKIYIILIFHFISIHTFSQDWTDVGNKELEPFRKNAVYGNVGTLGFYYAASGYFERTLTESTNEFEIERRGVVGLQKSRFATYVKVGFGAFADYFDQGKFLTGQVGIVTGAKKSHFELSIGASNVFDSTFVWGFQPAGSIGYRYQGPGDYMLLRIGAGYPEGVYVGLGFCI